MDAMIAVPFMQLVDGPFPDATMNRITGNG